MDYRYQASDPAVRYRGLAIVAVLHIFLAWALISGTARKGLEILKKPLEAVVIQEVIIPPPPPAPTPAPPAPPPPAPAKPAAKTDIAIACPTQVAPEMPRKALQDGTQGVVRAQALIKDGAVKEVTILSGPRVFHNAVRNAMLQYKCTQEAAEVLATQEFNFKLE